MGLLSAGHILGLIASKPTQQLPFLRTRLPKGNPRVRSYAYMLAAGWVYRRLIAKDVPSVDFFNFKGVLDGSCHRDGRTAHVCTNRLDPDILEK